MSVDIQTIAGILLVLRAVSVVFIVTVLTLQARLFGTQIDFALVPNLSNFQQRRVYLARRVLFALSVIILAGNMVPILIDTVTLLGNDLGRPGGLQLFSVAYAFSNALTAMFSAIMIWALYKLAGLGSIKEIEDEATIR